jgi:hypothetical protein
MLNYNIMNSSPTNTNRVRGNYGAALQIYMLKTCFEEGNTKVNLTNTTTCSNSIVILKRVPCSVVSSSGGYLPDDGFVRSKYLAANDTLNELS